MEQDGKDIFVKILAFRTERMFTGSWMIILFALWSSVWKEERKGTIMGVLFSLLVFFNLVNFEFMVSVEAHCL